MKIGDTVYFMLDGHPHARGEGTIVRPLDEYGYIEVKLTTTCKEFQVGQVINVLEREVILTTIAGKDYFNS